MTLREKRAHHSQTKATRARKTRRARAAAALLTCGFLPRERGKRPIIHQPLHQSKGYTDKLDIAPIAHSLTLRSTSGSRCRPCRLRLAVLATPSSPAVGKRERNEAGPHDGAAHPHDQGRAGPPHSRSHRRPTLMLQQAARTASPRTYGARRSQRYSPIQAPHQLHRVSPTPTRTLPHRSTSHRATAEVKPHTHPPAHHLTRSRLPASPRADSHPG